MSAARSRLARGCRALPEMTHAGPDRRHDVVEAAAGRPVHVCLRVRLGLKRKRDSRSSDCGGNRGGNRGGDVAGPAARVHGRAIARAKELARTLQ